MRGSDHFSPKCQPVYQSKAPRQWRHSISEEEREREREKERERETEIERD